MTLEDAIQQANAGDVETMVILGDYYGQNKDYDNALVWYRQASERGDLNATYKIFLLDGITLHTSIIVSPDESDDDTFREIDHCVCVLKEYPQFQLEPSYSDCKYAYAESLYRRDELGTLFSLVKDESAPRFRIMYAITLFGIARSCANDDDTAQYYEVSCNVIESVLRSGYVPGDAHNEQLSFVRAVSTYASVLRIGLNKNADVAGSYQVLAAQMDKITNEDAQSLLSDQLSHYRVKKGFFGTSITYID